MVKYWQEISQHGATFKTIEDLVGFSILFNDPHAHIAPEGFIEDFRVRRLDGAARSLGVETFKA